MNKDKFLIVGLGNIGIQYQNSRHNLGFQVINRLIDVYSLKSYSNTFGIISKITINKKVFFLLKPNTYMNYSGQAVKYWMTKEKIPLQSIMIILDDINLNFGILRIKSHGSSGGHNGLKNIQYSLNTSYYTRLRFGIANNIIKKNIKEYVLNSWTKEEMIILNTKLIKTTYAIISFGLYGLEKTMNMFNG